MKQCKGHCRKSLPSQDFHADQSRCKLCMSSHRRFKRLCQQQHEEEWFDDLEKTDPKAAHALLRRYDKQRPENGKRISSRS